MTNDTLRECQDLIYKLSLCESSMPEDIETLLRFARDQQAKGLEVAAILCEREAIIDDERGYYGKEMARAIRAKIASAS